jgi:hypothetical protein
MEPTTRYKEDVNQAGRLRILKVESCRFLEAHSPLSRSAGLSQSRGGGNSHLPSQQ